MENRVISEKEGNIEPVFVKRTPPLVLNPGNPLLSSGVETLSMDGEVVQLVSNILQVAAPFVNRSVSRLAIRWYNTSAPTTIGRFRQFASMFDSAGYQQNPNLIKPYRNMLVHAGGQREEMIFLVREQEDRVTNVIRVNWDTETAKKPRGIVLNFAKVDEISPGGYSFRKGMPNPEIRISFEEERVCMVSGLYKDYGNEGEYFDRDLNTYLSYNTEEAQTLKLNYELLRSVSLSPVDIQIEAKAIPVIEQVPITDKDKVNLITGTQALMEYLVRNSKSNGVDTIVLLQSLCDLVEASSCVISMEGKNTILLKTNIVTLVFNYLLETGGNVKETLKIMSNKEEEDFVLIQIQGSKTLDQNISERRGKSIFVKYFDTPRNNLVVKLNGKIVQVDKEYEGIEVYWEIRKLFLLQKELQKRKSSN